MNDEWHGVYPSLLCYVKILEKRKYNFKYRSISEKEVESFVMELCSAKECDRDPVYIEAQKYVDGNRSVSGFLNYLFRVLYKLGVVGIKTDTHVPIRWSYVNESTLHEGEVKPTSSIYIHPTFWRALGVESEVIKDDLEAI